MAWRDLGVIFPVRNLAPWAVSHCYVPTAMQMEDRIRVYASFWDANNYGRLGYVDVATKEPYHIIDYAKNPILADSALGNFDCHGVTPLSAIMSDDSIRLYYAGWQKFDLADKRYTIFTGLALNIPGSDMFVRFSDNYLMGPRNENELVRTGGMTLQDCGRWRTWFAAFHKLINVNGKHTPSYTLSTTSSDDGISWNNEEICVFPTVENAIMGYGRSAIWKVNDVYHGLFPVRAWNGRYSNICYSSSIDGIKWEPLSVNGMAFTTAHTCDNQTEVCFPSIIRQHDKTLMFYNGNDFGSDGLRLAIWTS